MSWWLIWGKMLREKINEDALIGINPLTTLINRLGPATRIETYLLLRSTSRIERRCFEC